MCDTLVALDEEAERGFDSGSGPSEPVKKCDSLNWTLTVVLKSTVEFWPRKEIKVCLDRTGTFKWFKTAKSANCTMTGTELRVDFTDTGTQKFEIYATMNEKEWFTWESASETKEMKNKEKTTVTIELSPLSVLIEMTPLSDSAIARLQADAEAPVANLYGLTKTVTAPNIQAIIGESNLKKGSIKAPAIVSKAAKLQDILGFTNQPFFGVIDLNLSHQMSYFLSVLAFRKFGKHANRLVVNFDNHIDFASYAGSVNYDKWGAGYYQEDKATIKQLWDLDEVSVVYTILGRTEQLWQDVDGIKGMAQQYYYSSADPSLASPLFRTDANVYLLARRTGKGQKWSLGYRQDEFIQLSDDDLNVLLAPENDILELKITHSNGDRKLFHVKKSMDGVLTHLSFAEVSESQFTAFSQKLDRYRQNKIWSASSGSDMLNETYTGDLSKTDVYITIDRDVMQKSFTYWNDGLLECGQLRDAVGRCLTFLKGKGANLVGFDLAGLPEAQDKGKSRILNDTLSDDVVRQAQTDIKRCREMVNDYYAG